MTETVTVVSCPRCQGTSLTTLALEEDRQRYQCSGCSENFSTPAAAPASAPDAVIPAQHGFTHSPIVMAEPDASGIMGHCPKCGRPYQRLGKFFDRHVASCDGTPFVPKNSPAEGAAAPAPKPEAAPKPETTPGAAEVVAPATPKEITKAFSISIDALKAQRSVLETEIQSINGVIATLEKLRGLGGASPGAPFSDGG